jgi:CHAT domain-containing protein
VVAQNCDEKYQQAQDLYKNKKRNEAVKLMDQVVVLCKEEFKTDIANYIIKLSAIGKFYKEVGEYGKAKPLYEEIEKMITKIVPPGSELHIKSINNLSTISQLLGENKEAEIKLLKIKYILDTCSNRDDTAVATNFSNLGNLYKNMSKTDTAILYLTKASDIFKKIGKRYEQALCLYNLGETYMRTPEFNKSEINFLSALEIFKELHKETDIFYEKINQGLAHFYEKKGNIAKADQYLTKSNSFPNKNSDETSSAYLNSQVNIAEYYRYIGNYEKAEKILVVIIRNCENASKTSMPEYRDALYTLALVYFDKQELEKSEKTIKQIVNTQNEHLTRNSLLYRKSLNLLSEIYLISEKITNCENELNKLLNIYVSFSLRKDIIYAKMLIRWAKIEFKNRLYPSSEARYLDALRIYKDLYGEENQDYITLLYNLGLLYEESGNVNKASAYFSKSVALLQRFLNKNIHHISASDAEKFIASNIDLFNRFNSLLYRNRILSITPDLVNFSLMLKNILLSSSNHLENAVKNTKDSSIIHLWHRYNNIKDTIADITFLEANENIRLNELIEKSEIQEKELKRKVPGFQEFINNNQKTWIDIRNSLKSGEVAIDFVKFIYIDQGLTDSIKYVAYIIRPEWNEPRFQFLFNEDDLSKIVDPNNTEATLNRMYKAVETGTFSNSALYNLIWKPLESHLINSNTIYLSLSGLLHRLSFAAISMPEGGILNDKYELRYFGNLKDITKAQNAADQIVKASILFGGINYELEPSLIVSDVVISNNVIDSTTRSIKNTNWTYLSGTLEEVKSIQEISNSNGINSVVYSATNASEEQFRQIVDIRNSTSYLIHFASHGFSFNTRDTTYLKDQNLKGINSTLSSRNKIIASSDALSRSGLIMSGANQAWKRGICYPNREDGILTAREISNMDLSGCTLVTLSACETGLGELKGSEGVFGLQRGFRMAGVKHQIVSLWKVPDKETSIFMQIFYKNWLSEKMSINAAFRETQKMMSKKYKPYQWAAFILVQ